MAAMLFLCFHADVTTTAPCQQLWPLITTTHIPADSPDGNIVFTWTNNGVNVTAWELRFSKSPGGALFSHYYDATNPTRTTHPVSISSLKDGPIYVQFGYQVKGGGWHYMDYEYPGAGQPSIVKPLQNSLLCDSMGMIEFNWLSKNNDNLGVEKWELVIGPYKYDDYDEVIDRDAGLPNYSVNLGYIDPTTKKPTHRTVDGKYYAHLWYRINGTWHCAGDGRFNCAIFSYIPLAID
jgi:hypothetical protein